MSELPIFSESDVWRRRPRRRSQAQTAPARPSPHETPHINVHAISLPARTFTGDFWFTHRTAGRLWFALGDVAGKGLPAAVVMAMIQEELEHRITSCATAGCDPATTMTRLHSFLKPLLPSNRFATAVIGCLRDDGSLMVVNAGHCPPMIVRADGRIEEIDSTGPVVGIIPSSRWHSTTVALSPGSLQRWRHRVTVDRRRRFRDRRHPARASAIHKPHRRRHSDRQRGHPTCARDRAVRRPHGDGDRSLMP
jgi:serine phosphatase RsbU (regulator of sigma subunit)